MAKIQRNASGFTRDRKPALLPEHVNGDATVVTIAEVNTPKVGGVQKVVIVYEEYPHHSYWLNATMTDYMVAVLGDDTDEWKGERVPLEKIMVENPTTGEPVERLYVMPPREWPDAFDAFDGVSKEKGTGKAAAKKATAKRGGK